MVNIIKHILGCALLLAATTHAHNNPHLLVKHVQVIKELKDRFTTKESTSGSYSHKTNKTQTEAHFSIYKESISTNYGSSLIEHKELIDSIRKTEKEHAGTHYVFYHGMRFDFMILQDLLKEFYALYSLKNISDFEFTRAALPYFELAYSQYDNFPFEDVNTYLDNNPELNDLKNPYKSQLLSVNLSLFGNYNDIMCSSFYYFMNDFNLGHVDIESFFRILFYSSSLKFNEKYIKPLLELQEQIKTKEGLLLQIFIPKESVNKYVYLSRMCGIPWSGYIEAQTYDTDKKRHTKISGVLEKYIHHPEDIAALDSLQARIVLTPDFMLNPDNGVKIVRYTTADKQALIKYQKELKALTQQIFAQWIYDNSHTSYTDTHNPNVHLTKLINLTKNNH